MSDDLKPVRFVGTSRRVLRSFPAPVRQNLGYALYVAQKGGRAGNAKALRGIVTGAGVLEVVEDHDGNAYRAVYTVRFEGVVYVLHVFQKKSKRNVSTPKVTIDLIRTRYEAARQDYESGRTR